MVVVGFNLTKISIERKEEMKEKLEVKSNIDIEDIKEEKIDLAKDKKVLVFYFSFSLDYEPDIAKLEFKGNVLLLLEPNKIKDILKEWKKKSVSEEIKLPLYNTILTKCNLKALALEEDLNLPPHIPFPRFKKQD